MAEDYLSGASEPEIAGAEQSPENLTVEALMAFPPKASRPKWMVTRFPVSMEEYQKLNEAANQPDAKTLAAAEDQAGADADVEMESMEDVPEGEELVMGPEALAPATTNNFEGIPQTAFRPPDCTIAVGPNDVMVSVNTDLAIYTKGGALRFRWANMSLFNPVQPANATFFDPQVAYDHYAKRWIVVTAARRNSPAGSWLMVGVSQGPDPVGPYWIWALDATKDGSNPTNNWADFPMLGFDTQGIYISSNMFLMGGGFQYVKLRILNKAEVYAGGVGPSHFIKWYDFWSLKNPNNSLSFTVQPAAHFTGLGGNPPAFLINALWPGGNTLTLWKLSNPIGYWSGSTPTLTKDSIACRSYDLPPDAEQKGSAVRIETNDSRLLNAVYQYVDGVRRLWTCHTSKHTWAGENVARSVAQWYEIDTDQKKVIQQNAYGAKGRYYFFPAIHTDLRRHAYVVVGRSSSTEFAHLRQTGRLVTDPANDLQNSTLVKVGESSYTGGRWGDYFGICRDGSDANKVWMYGQYADAGNTWGTRICAAKF
jgi:hypothetical protein